MLQITTPSIEMFDEKTQRFFYSEEYTLQLEHSLVSLSKWESKWHKPFLTKEEKSIEETIDYIRCMTINKNVNPEAYQFLSNKNIEDIKNYIDDPMTATTFSDQGIGGRPNREIVTSELIYYWMISYNIPVEFEKWHLERLITLIRVCSIKSQSSKKMSKREIMSRNAQLNEARRKQLNTKG